MLLPEAMNIDLPASPGLTDFCSPELVWGSACGAHGAHSGGGEGDAVIPWEAGGPHL